MQYNIISEPKLEEASAQCQHAPSINQEESTFVLTLRTFLSKNAPPQTALALERENKRRERVYSYFPALRPALAESGDVSAPRPPQGTSFLPSVI